MVRSGRVRVKKDKKKPGPASYREQAIRPRRAGQAKRRQFRVNKRRSPRSLQRYRGGYRLMWKRAGRYCKRLRRFPPPNTCDVRNQMRGVMPALPGEFWIAGKAAATILEKCADHADTKGY